MNLTNLAPLLILGLLTACSGIKGKFDDFDFDGASDSFEERFEGFDFEDIDSIDDVQDLWDDDDFRDRIDDFWGDLRGKF